MSGSPPDYYDAGSGRRGAPPRRRRGGGETSGGGGALRDDDEEEGNHPEAEATAAGRSGSSGGDDEGAGGKLGGEDDDEEGAGSLSPSAGEFTTISNVIDAAFSPDGGGQTLSPAVKSSFEYAGAVASDGGDDDLCGGDRDRGCDRDSYESYYDMQRRGPIISGTAFREDVLLRHHECEERSIVPYDHGRAREGDAESGPGADSSLSSMTDDFVSVSELMARASASRGGTSPLSPLSMPSQEPPRSRSELSSRRLVMFGPARRRGPSVLGSPWFVSRIQLQPHFPQGECSERRRRNLPEQCTHTAPEQRPPDPESSTPAIARPPPQEVLIAPRWNLNDLFSDPTPSVVSSQFSEFFTNELRERYQRDVQRSYGRRCLAFVELPRKTVRLALATTLVVVAIAVSVAAVGGRGSNPRLREGEAASIVVPDPDNHLPGRGDALPQVCCVNRYDGLDAKDHTADPVHGHHNVDGTGLDFMGGAHHVANESSLPSNVHESDQQPGFAGSENAIHTPTHTGSGAAAPLQTWSTSPSSIGNALGAEVDNADSAQGEVDGAVDGTSPAVPGESSEPLQEAVSFAMDHVQGSYVGGGVTNNSESLPPTGRLTGSPATGAPITGSPVTRAPVTRAPVTRAPVTGSPVTGSPVTRAPVTGSPVTRAPVTAAPVTAAPVTGAPVTGAPITMAPTTGAPITWAPVTGAPVTPVVPLSPPTLRPTGGPTIEPSSLSLFALLPPPTPRPSLTPSALPSAEPSSSPPSRSPTRSPTLTPTNQPTLPPTYPPFPQPRPVSIPPKSSMARIRSVDTTVDASNPDRSYGSDPFLHVNGSSEVALLKFDIGSIQGRIIKKATLDLHLVAVNDEEVREQIARKATPNFQLVQDDDTRHRSVINVGGGVIDNGATRVWVDALPRAEDWSEGTTTWNQGANSAGSYRVTSFNVQKLQPATVVKRRIKVDVTWAIKEVIFSGSPGAPQHPPHKFGASYLTFKLSVEQGEGVVFASREWNKGAGQPQLEVRLVPITEPPTRWPTWPPSTPPPTPKPTMLPDPTPPPTQRPVLTTLSPTYSNNAVRRQGLLFD